MAAADRNTDPSLMRGLKSAVRNDATAFSYSILITATFGAVQLEVGSPSAARLVLFVLGATGAFTVIEALGSRMFQDKMRGERGDVVVLGTALAPISVSVSLLIGLGVLQVVGGTLAWVVTPALATASYVGLAALQLTLARRYEERHPPKR